MLLIKRDKSAQVFDESKFRKSLNNIFQACNSELTDEIFSKIMSRVTLKDGMTTSDLRKNLENILMMLGYYEQARCVIVYHHINRYSKGMSDRVRFMRDYLSASNPATGSKYDANANVTTKNITTLSGELFKGDIIKLNRYRLHSRIQDMYDKSLADEYVHQLEEHLIYKHDESSLNPYCVAFTMYPFLLNGLKDLGGLSEAPKSLESYCGGFINLCFAVSAQFAGAVSTPEFLLYFDYFARKDFGEDYYQIFDEFYTVGPKLRKLMNTTGKWFRNISELKMYDFGSQELNYLRDEIVYDTERPLTSDELEAWHKEIEEKIQKGEEIPMRVTKGGDNSHTIGSMITQLFQQVVYSNNQPAAARSYQSIFWNIGYFDKYYFDGIFGEFCFPDGSRPVWESLWNLQKKFMKWFNAERLRAPLTFPVESFSMLIDKNTGEYMDKEAADFVAEMYAEGHSFFTYVSDNPDALSSCCRLRNEVQENVFSYSLGAGGVATGSKSVMTLNLNRFIQNCIKNGVNYIDALRVQIQKMHKYQIAFNDLIKEFFTAGALPVYDAGYISLEKQYLTLGINGAVEAAEFLGISPRNTKEYQEFTQSILKVFNEENKKAKTKELMFNTEFVPAENLGVKFYKWDKEDGYVVPTGRNCYNSYFYASEDTQVSILEKFKLHGREFVKYLDGGSAAHINLDEHLSKEQYMQLLKVAAKEGTNYFTFNIPNTVCNDCGHITKKYLKVCPKCGSQNLDYLTRIIGYLKRVSNFSEARQVEASNRYYAKNTEEEKELINKELE
jgi:ribonucleoside-triphosphate reductase